MRVLWALGVPCVCSVRVLCVLCVVCVLALCVFVSAMWAVAEGEVRSVCVGGAGGAQEK